MKKTFLISGLDCANCAIELEQKIKNQNGVLSASVNFVKQKITVDCQDEVVFKRILEIVENFESVKVVKNAQIDKKLVFKERMADIISIIISFTFLLVSLLISPKLTVLRYIFFGISYVASGWSVLYKTVKNLVRGKIFDENFLMTIASIGAICLFEFAEAVEVMLLYRIGELLQSVVVGASRKSISNLINLKSESANVIINGEEKNIPPEEIRIGDVIIVKSGEKIAVDGVVVNGETSLDCKSLTGESAFVDVCEGESVLGGSINVGSVIKVKAEKEYKDSTVAKILDIVENSSTKKSKSEKFITKFARIYTPVVCLLAIFVAFVAPLFSGENYADFSVWVYRALTFLVISCPCALVISIPLSYFSGIGYSAKHGLLLKGSTALDALSNTKIFAFDKTGTLTYGNFTVSNAFPANENISKEFLLSLTATAEKYSSHPIAKAFVGIKTLSGVDSATEFSGRGVVCSIGEKILVVGNSKLMAEYQIFVEQNNSSATQIFVCYDGVYQGYIEIEDKIKESSKQAISSLKKQGAIKVVMLTGDNKIRAQKVANAVGITQTYSQLLPNEKLEIAQKLKEQGNVCFVGDGVNDAPVLMQSDLGVSMGGVGSDAAIEASDAVLISDDLQVLSKAYKIAKKTRKIVVENIVFSISLKLVLMILGLFDIIPLWLAVFADVGVMLIAVLNSIRARTGIKEESYKVHDEIACTCACCLEKGDHNESHECHCHEGQEENHECHCHEKNISE